MHAIIILASTVVSYVVSAVSENVCSVLETGG